MQKDYSLKELFLLGILSVSALFLFNMFIIIPCTAQNVEEPIIIDGDTVEYSADAKEVIAQGNVVVTYQDARMTCDKIVVNTQTKDGEATGNVRLEEQRGILEAEKLIYNFQTKQGEILRAKLRSSPYYYYGNKIKRLSESEYVVKDGYFSSCNYKQPHFRIRSKRVEVYPGDKLVARRNTLYWMDRPLFYFPRYSHNFKDPFMKVQFQAGKTSDWGVFLLSIWRFDLNDNARLKIFLDWREKWGFADGFGINYDTKNMGTGDFKVYHTHERRTNESQLTHQEFQRYFVRFRHAWDIDEETKLTAQYYRIEDSRRGWHPNADMLRDYFFREYEKNSRPKSYILINRTLPKSNMSMIIQKRTNRWYDETEKLPEIAYNLQSSRIGTSPFYLENQTKLSSLNKKYATPSEFDDDVVRFDTFNKLTLPIKFMFLEFSPYVGTRETIYSKNIWGESISPRTVFYTGTNVSTKFYRVFNVVTNFLKLNINRLRHVIDPSITYSYIHEPTISPSNLQQFDGIDSVNGTNRFDLSLENRLQTKRDGKSVDLLILRPSTSYIMYSKADNISKAEGKFTDYLLELELIPYSWLRMEADATYDHLKDYFKTVTVDSWFSFEKDRKFGIGHRYSRGSNKEMTSQIVWRINPKWSFRTYWRYQFRKPNGGLREQEYTIYRDLHCATLELTINRKEKAEAKSERSFWVGFNLKIFKESEFDYVQSYHPPKVLE
jgi:hypothetical protein